MNIERRRKRLVKGTPVWVGPTRQHPGVIRITANGPSRVCAVEMQPRSAYGPYINVHLSNLRKRTTMKEIPTEFPYKLIDFTLYKNGNLSYTIKTPAGTLDGVRYNITDSGPVLEQLSRTIARLNYPHEFHQWKEISKRIYEYLRSQGERP